MNQLYSNRGRAKSAKACRRARRASARPSRPALCTTGRASVDAARTRADRITIALDALAAVPPCGESYRAEALLNLQLSGRIFRALACGTFGTLNGGYRLALADAAKVEHCLVQMREVFRTGEVVFDRQQEQRIKAKIGEGLQHSAPGWSMSALYAMGDTPADGDTSEGGAT